jgi:hypothetical protein
LRRVLAAIAGLAFCIVPGLVSADVTLFGAQHIGDSERADMAPSDPVRRAQEASNSSRFHLSQTTTITGVRLGAPRVYQNRNVERVLIDGTSRNGDFDDPSHTFEFDAPLTLPAGVHTIAVDPGCLNNGGNPQACPGNNENDVSFGSLILRSAQTTTSRSFNRRRHIGDDDEGTNDDYLGRYYPDPLDPPPGNVRVDESFSIEVNRVLNQIQFYRLRDVETSAGSHAQVLIDGVPVAVLSTSGSPLVLPVVMPLAAGTHTLSVIAGSNGPGNRDSISWDDILLFFSAPSGGTPGRFNAVDPGEAAVNGSIRTKVAGSAFALDIVALDLDGSSLLPGYAGSVTVELLDAGNDAGALDPFGCRSSWTALQSFGPLDFSASDQGRRALTLGYGNLLRVARVRVVDTATGIGGCSVDTFAIRPAEFAVQASHDGPTTAGTLQALDEIGTGGTHTHRAGQPFTVRATARAASGSALSAYTGSPILSVQSTIEGTQAGTLIPGSWSGTGTRRTDGARYTEAGTFNLQVTDSIFADVDADDTTLSQREFSGTVGVGRFTPDHFRLVSRNTPSFQPACGTFGYVGQPFDYESDAAPEAIVEAVNAAGGRTLNYEGELAKLPSNLGPSIYRAVNGSGASVSLDAAAVPSPDNAVIGQGGGTARITWRSQARLAVVRTATPIAPFDLEIELQAAHLQDADGVLYADPAADPLKFGVAAAGGGIAFTGGGKQQRYGRLFVRNAYGPETLPLNVVYGVERYAGTTTGFGSNLADSCTLPGAVTLADGIAASTSVQSISAPVVAGQGVIRLAPPAGAQTGTLDVKLGGDAWLLLPDANGDGVGDPAVGQAAFGRFREPDRRIYQRETYR